MKKILRSTDFNKIKKFIATNAKLDQNNIAMVKQISSVELYIGKCHITRSDEDWIVSYYDKIKVFGTKRNAMYYAFLTAYKNTNMIPALISIDTRLSNTQSDIVRYKYMLSHKEVRTDNFKIGLYHNKLSEAVARYKQAKLEMHDWMNCAKYIHN